MLQNIYQYFKIFQINAFLLNITFKVFQGFHKKAVLNINSKRFFTGKSTCFLKDHVIIKKLSDFINIFTKQKSESD